MHGLVNASYLDVCVTVVVVRPYLGRLCAVVPPPPPVAFIPAGAAGAGSAGPVSPAGLSRSECLKQPGERES